MTIILSISTARRIFNMLGSIRLVRVEGSEAVEINSASEFVSAEAHLSSDNLSIPRA